MNPRRGQFSDDFQIQSSSDSELSKEYSAAASLTWQLGQLFPWRSGQRWANQMTISAMSPMLLPNSQKKPAAQEGSPCRRFHNYHNMQCHVRRAFESRKTNHIEIQEKICSVGRETMDIYRSSHSWCTTVTEHVKALEKKQNISSQTAR